MVDLILGATSVEELISNFYYYGKVSEEKARLIANVKDAHERLENKKAELSEQQETLREVSRVQTEQLEAMRDKQYEAQLVIDGLDKEVRDLVAKRDAELLAAQLLQRSSSRRRTNQTPANLPQAMMPQLRHRRTTQPSSLSRNQNRSRRRRHKKRRQNPRRASPPARWGAVATGRARQPPWLPHATALRRQVLASARAGARTL